MQEGQNMPMRMVVLLYWLIKTYRVFVLGKNATESFQLQSCLSCLFMRMFYENVFVVNSRDGVPPYRYRKQYRREMHESAKANGRVALPHIPVSYSWAISLPLSLSASTPLFNCLSLPYFSALHHWRCAYLSSAVLQSLWWSIRIADGKRKGCLNAAWCFLKLCALKPSRHKSTPVTAWCLPLQLMLSLGRKAPALIRPWSKESN